MKVALLIVATNKYVKFVQPLIESAEKYFLTDESGKRNHEVGYCIFTDRIDEVKGFTDAKVFRVQHQPFPYPTLMRFHFFKEDFDNMVEFDQFVYVDADALFVNHVGDEILAPRCPVQHCGFVNRRGTYDTNRRSMAFVNQTEGTHYFGGGFWSFSKDEFVKLVEWATFAIDTDIANNAIAVHNDESILNRYLINNLPTKILSPSYHYPEPPNDHIYGLWKAQGVTFEPKIYMLNKNHEEIRA